MPIYFFTRAHAARLFAAGFSLAAIVLGVLATRAESSAASHHINASTRFDHVAIFAAGTSNAAIDMWRSLVLGRVHEQACADGRPCTRRLMRISRSGEDAVEMLAFDLDPTTPDIERAAIVAAALRTEPSPSLRDAISPQHVSFN